MTKQELITDCTAKLVALKNELTVINAKLAEAEALTERKRALLGGFASEG